MNSSLGSINCPAEIARRKSTWTVFPKVVQRLMRIEKVGHKGLKSLSAVLADRKKDFLDIMSLPSYSKVGVAAVESGQMHSRAYVLPLDMRRDYAWIGLIMFGLRFTSMSISAGSIWMPVSLSLISL